MADRAIASFARFSDAAAFAVLLFALGACGAGQTNATDLAQSAGFSISGGGNEPGWNVSVAGKTIRLVTDYGETVRDFEVTTLAPTPDGAVVTSVEDGTVVFRLVKTDELCLDTMAGAPFPYRVSVETGGNRYEGCGGDTLEYLTLSEWTVRSVNGRVASGETTPIVNFGADGLLAGHTGCNSFGGSFRLIEGRIESGPLRVTRRACMAEALDAQEAGMLGILSGSFGFAETDGQLTVISGSGDRMVLTR